MEEEAAEVKARKSRRYGSDTIEFRREKVKQDLVIRKEEVERKEREEERHGRLQVKSNLYLPSNSSSNIKCKC